jgi:deoxyribodipyrimidine photo-lyase
VILPSFPCDYQSIVSRLHAINPVLYGKTRNYVHGDVTYLSPYVSRGIISTKFILESVLSCGYTMDEIIPFVKQLAWRDYFQRVWQLKDVEKDIRYPQESVLNFGIPDAVINASTGIKAIDDSIDLLYKAGYMHNHCRMYVASIACNIAGSYWHNPSRWMYYHLLDGDLASNNCSWQWVAGANSSKKYFANQENISRFSNTPHVNSFLDIPYESFGMLNVPDVLTSLTSFGSATVLPEVKPLIVDAALPTFIYNYYNLDSEWRKHEPGNRILLLEPEIFKKYPVSEKCISFLLECSKNIPGIQIFTGAFSDLLIEYSLGTIYYREHPINAHYSGICDEREWISTNVTGYFPSFFSYWKQLSRELNIKEDGRKAH